MQQTRRGENMEKSDQKTIDPLMSLYVDKSPEQKEADERLINFFRYLLNNRSVQELFT